MLPRFRYKTGARERIICLSSQYPRPGFWPWSGPLRGLLFGLAPDGVFRACAITRAAVGSYPAFSPLPLTHSSSGGIFSVALSVEGTFRLPRPCLSHPHKHGLHGIAPYGVRTFLPERGSERFSALPGSIENVAYCGKIASGRLCLNRTIRRFETTGSHCIERWERAKHRH